MSSDTPDPYIAQTGFDADEWTGEPDLGADELEIEEDRARER